MQSELVNRWLRPYLDSERRRRLSPRTLLGVGAIAWTAICMVGYGTLLYLFPIADGTATDTTPAQQETVRVLCGIWWPYIWAVPMLILLTVRWFATRAGKKEGE